MYWVVTLIVVVIRPHLHPSELRVNSAVEYCRTFLPQSDHTTKVVVVVVAVTTVMVLTMVVGLYTGGW